MKSLNYKEKLKSRFSWIIEISSIKTESNRWFHRTPEIILWSLRSFRVERFDLNQSLKIDFGRKSCHTVEAINYATPRLPLGPHREVWFGHTITPNPISRSRWKLPVCFCCRSLSAMCSKTYCEIIFPKG